MNNVSQIVSTPLGTLAVLLLAAFLEAFGDSCFQSGLYHSVGITRAFWFLAGGVVLAAYGLTVNTPPWDFGKLLGIYVVLFFLVAQVLARVRFQQSPTLPIYAGGALIVAGGLLMTFWRP